MVTHEHDALLTVDELQAGYRRTGEIWGVDHYGVVPDTIPQANGTANGLPLDTLTARKEVADASGPATTCRHSGGTRMPVPRPRRRSRTSRTVSPTTLPG